MENIDEFIHKMKDIYQNLVDFIDNSEEKSLTYIEFIKNQSFRQNIFEQKLYIHLISKIVNNHYHSRNFFDKIEQILIIFKDDLLEKFSNSDIFSLFKKSKRILFFLIQNKILVIDDIIANKIMKEKFFIQGKYPNYFLTEIKPFLQHKVLKKIESFNRNAMNIYNKKDDSEEECFESLKKNGENENFLCKLIRNDSIDEFIQFVNKTNYSLSSTIKPSIFESNYYLIEKEPTLIEYAAFFGSIQVFKYLFLNGVELNQFLWFYAIHGRNAELIHFLEEKQIKPPDNNYQECLNEALKCHHNEIANYIFNNYLQQNENDDEIDCFAKSIQYINFAMFPDNLTNPCSFFYLCKCNYIQLVKIILENQDLNVNKQIILNSLLNRILSRFFCKM